MSWQAALEVAKIIGPMLADQARGAADGRAQQAMQQGMQDNQRESQARTAQQAETQAGGLDLQRQQFLEQSRGNRARQAAIGDLLAGHQPTRVSVPGIRNAEISGGLKLGDAGRAGGAELSRQALLAMLQPPEFTGGQVLPSPGVTPLPQAGGWEKAAGILGTLGSLAGGLGQAGVFGGGQDTGPMTYGPQTGNIQGLSKKPYDDLFRG